MNCVSEGKVPIDFSDELLNSIEKEIIRYHKSYSIEEIESSKNSILAELTRTPPVPWIQSNEWPVCCGDFMRYVGEWSRDNFEEMSPNKNGKEYLISLIDESTRNHIENVDEVWKVLGEYIVAFVFECLRCDKRVVIIQDY